MTRISSSLSCRLRLLALLFAASALVACATNAVMVAVPPRVDLTRYPAIGVIDLVAQPSGEVGEDATRKVIDNLQSAQPGLRILELGNQDRLLREVGANDLDRAAIKAIGAKYGVEAVLSGTITLSQVRSNIKTSAGISAIPNNSSIAAKTKVDGVMSARLWETADGTNIWRNSSKGSWTVAGLSFSSSEAPSAEYRYPQDKQDQILMSLIKPLYGDFWPTYEKKAVGR